MATNYLYLTPEDMKKLASGEKLEIQLSPYIRMSDKMVILVDQSEKEE